MGRCHLYNNQTGVIFHLLLIGQNSHSHPLLLFMLVDEILLFLSVEFSQDVVLIILLQLAVGTISIEDRSKFDRIHFSN